MEGQCERIFTAACEALMLLEQGGLLHRLVEEAMRLGMVKGWLFSIEAVNLMVVFITRVDRLSGRTWRSGFP